MIFVAIFVTSLFDQVDFCQAAFCTFWCYSRLKSKMGNFTVFDAL